MVWWQSRPCCCCNHAPLQERRRQSGRGRSHEHGEYFTRLRPQRTKATSKVGGECTSCRDTITLNFSFMKETEASLLSYRDASWKTLVISIFLCNYYKTLLIFYSWSSHSKTIIRYTDWVLLGSFCFYTYFFAIWKMSIFIMSIPNCLWSFNGILIDFYNVCIIETFWIF